MREDAVGNMFARWTGARPELGAIGTGSHIDAIPHSGKFDGTVGVLGGLEAIRALQQSGFQPQRSIELCSLPPRSRRASAWDAWEAGCWAAAWTAPPMRSLKDSEGQTLAQLRAAAGFHGSLDEVRLHDGYYAGFVELHIEQGPLLEKEGLAVGIVTSIAAPAALRISVEGEGGHAGGVLMHDRKDAFCAAAEIVLAIEERALATGAIDTCATVGKCHVYPGAVNSIPSRVEMEADIRDTDEAAQKPGAARDRAGLRSGLRPSEMFGLRLRPSMPMLRPHAHRTSSRPWCRLPHENGLALQKDGQPRLP